AAGVLLALFLGGLGWAEAKVWVPTPIHEFGELVDGELHCWDFPLENVGTAELILGPVAPSCACTFVPLAQDRLAPGERLWVRVCFDASGYGGKHVEEFVSIRTNDPEQPWVRLALRGYVQPAAPYQAPAKQLLASLYLLLDVRSPEEHDQGRLLGAVNLPWSELPRWLASLPRGLPIVVYGGEESRAAVELLRGHGFLARALVGDVHFWLGPFVAGKLQSLAAAEGVPTIRAEALAQRYVVVLDLRPAETFAEGALPGAVWASAESVLAGASTLPKVKDLPAGVRYTVWLVDEDGKLAAAVARALWEGGLPAVGLVGGLRDWRARYGSAWLIPPFWAEHPGGCGGGWVPPMGRWVSLHQCTITQ
ncbi:MAG: rhodanese-like domain-containing protein, partial [Candidatus Bipolaricaulaceae bacterium]